MTLGSREEETLQSEEETLQTPQTPYLHPGLTRADQDGYEAEKN